MRTTRRLRPLAAVLLLAAAGAAARDPAPSAGVAAPVEGRLAEVVGDVEPTLRRWAILRSPWSWPST
ncbi:MAG TPA: hypothetical protein VFY87_02195 [Geminicoccaceae bacterium]|nr:hypothetical protein [Geminicoccaceae bacterium]